MAAPKYRSKLERGSPDLRDFLELHAQAAKKLKLLLDEYQTLFDGGKKKAAREVLIRTERIQTVMRAIEGKVKQST